MNKFWSNDLYGRNKKRAGDGRPDPDQYYRVSRGGIQRKFTEHDSYAGLWRSYTPMIIEGGEYYRLFTCMFLHFGIEHLLNNMLVLFVLGSRLERVIGKIKFLIIYLVGGLLGNVISVLVELKSMDFAVSAGASGAVFAVMGAMIYIVVRNKGWLGDLSARQILVMAFFSLYYGFTSTGVDNTAHVAGLVCGMIISILLYHPRGRRI